MNTQYNITEYAGQDTSGFEYIGVSDKTMETLTDIEVQVAELRRRYGDQARIWLYNPKEASARV